MEKKRTVGASLVRPFFVTLISCAIGAAYAQNNEGSVSPRVRLVSDLGSSAPIRLTPVMTNRREVIRL
jgi:hypothetical protein